MRVMLGGCTCSTAASSPRVIGPSRSMLASAPWVEAVSSSPVARRLLADAPGQAGHGQAQLRRQLALTSSVGVDVEGDVRRWRCAGSRKKLSIAN